jgi:Ser/Thr protein kinase RdoA (MazF antagonist)
MAGVVLPPFLLRDAGLAVVPGPVPVRDGRAWLVDWQRARGILRARPVPADPASRAAVAADAAWLHGFLGELAGLGFASSRPLPAFAGRSWTLAAGQLWELTSFIPGREVGWSDRPPLEEVGGLLARYHAAARRAQAARLRRRPGVIPLAEVPAVLLSAQLDAACPDAEQAGLIRRLATRLASDLAALGAQDADRLVIHGDFTCHNVIADGNPPRPAGVIDFQRAHAETAVADIGYGLWRSGRPAQDAARLDLARLTRFVRGYASAAPLTADAAATLPVFLYGRGLQMIARRAAEGRPGTGMLTQVRWTARHAAAIADAAANAAAGAAGHGRVITRTQTERPDLARRDQQLARAQALRGIHAGLPIAATEAGFTN